MVQNTNDTNAYPLQSPATGSPLEGGSVTVPEMLRAYTTRCLCTSFFFFFFFSFPSPPPCLS